MAKDTKYLLTEVSKYENNWGHLSHSDSKLLALNKKKLENRSFETFEDVLEKYKDNSTYRVAIRKTITARKKAQELMKMAKIAELEARRMECKLINIGEEPLCYWKRKQYGLQYKKRDFIRNTLYDPDEWYDVAISSVSDSGDDDS